MLELIEGILGERLSILITLPYHVRSSEELRERFRKAAETTIWGHPACAKRLRRKAGFKPIDPATPLPARRRARTRSASRAASRRRSCSRHTRRSSSATRWRSTADACGSGRPSAVDDKVERFYRERFNPTLKPLLELDFDRVLVTHGEPVMKDGKKALRSALRSKPWYHRG